MEGFRNGGHYSGQDLGVRGSPRGVIGIMDEIMNDSVRMISVGHCLGQ